MSESYCFISSIVGIHDMIMKKYGLDKHTASAYLIALKGLKKVNKCHKKL